jgi:hypothetical protein
MPEEEPPTLAELTGLPDDAPDARTKRTAERVLRLLKENYSQRRAPPHPEFSGDFFRTVIERSIANIRQTPTMSRRQQGRSGARKNWKKHATACVAYNLLRFDGIKPTLSDGGPFFELASILYEGETGIAGADLSRACRIVFHERASAWDNNLHPNWSLSNW